MQIRRFSAGKITVTIGILWLFLFGSPAGAGSTAGLSKGATVYVSIYSHLYAGPKAITYNLASMLSIRNTDPKFSITITFADYYNSEGKLVERYLK